MAKITAHARERLKERYNISDSDSIQQICCLLNQPRSYKVINENNAKEIRQIVFGNVTLQAVVNRNHILTFIPLTFSVDENLETVDTHRVRIQKIEQRFRQNRKIIDEQNIILDNLFKNNIYKAFIFFLYYRVINKNGSVK